MLQQSTIELDEDWYDEPDREPARRRGSIVALAAWALLAGAATATGMLTLRSDPDGPAAAAETAPPPRWVEIADASPMLTLSEELVGPASYKTKTRVDGGRADILTAGTVAKDSRFLRIELESGLPASGDDGLFVDIVRHAARAGLAITRAGQAVAVETRIGTIQASRVTAAAASGEAECLGFRSAPPGASARLVGLACGSGPAPIDEADLACTLSSLRFRTDTEPDPSHRLADPRDVACTHQAAVQAVRPSRVRLAEGEIATPVRHHGDAAVLGARPGRAPIP